jgi:catechol 2,3-dioxygenase-like lactoylglutathione lyase family enzyme
VAYHLHHIHITAKDPHRSARWWADTFGAIILPEREMRSILFAPVSLDGVTINISGPRVPQGGLVAEDAPIPHYGLEHLGVSVDDLETTLALFQAQGCQIYERHESPAMKIAFVAGPDGICFELLEQRR